MRPIFFTAVLLWVASRMAAAADLVLLDHAPARQGVVRLGDVAAVLNASREEIDRLVDVPLMPAPAPGAATRVRAQEVRDLLAAQGIDLGSVRLAGAAEVVVGGPAPTTETAAAPVPQRLQSGFRTTGPRSDAGETPTGAIARKPAKLPAHRLAALRERLRAGLQAFVTRQTGDPLLLVAAPELNDAQAAGLAGVEGEFRFAASGPLGEGAHAFTVAGGDAPGGAATDLVAEVRRATPAVTLRRDVPRGAALTAADLQVAPLPEGFRPRAGETPFDTVEQAIGRETQRNLVAGDVATDATTLAPRLVRRGELVTVSAGGGGVRVRMRCKALREGRLGELVTVQSIDTSATLEARVTGRAELAILAAPSSVGPAPAVAAQPNLGGAY